MKEIAKKVLFLNGFLILVLLGACSGGGTEPDEPEEVLWYDTPASNWNEALPVGNGRLGAMVFGRVNQERIQLNEETVWSRQGAYKDSDGSQALPKVRELLFEGKYKEAQDLAVNELLQERLPTGTNAYQTLGDITIAYEDTSEVSDYRRELRLDSALVRVTYTRNGIKYRRRVFSSAANNVLVFQEEAGKGGRINCSLELSRPGEGEVLIMDNNLITMKQRMAGENGLLIEARLKVINTDGHTHVEGKKLLIHGARKLELRLFAGTDYRGNDPCADCDRCMAHSVKCNYNRVLTDHVKEYQKLYNRVSLDLGASATSGLPTNQRLVKVAEGNPDPGLATLYFNFGRYLLISSSRPGNLPANLQGIWNEHMKPPWNSDYHININVQMNYWPSELTNLSECHLPYLEFIGRLRESGRKSATRTYNCRGFMAHHTTDAWHQTQLFGSPNWGMWPMGAAWSATHIWEHYLFTGDTAFLANYGYELMREAALFLSDFLVEHPKTGALVTGPSISPENRFATPAGDTAAMNMGPAMDLQIVWHLFTSVIEAGKVLARDHEFRSLLQAQLEQLAPVKIGSDGRILEWSEEGLVEVEPGHRHISHLYGLYPSPQYNWTDTPEYMEAARKVLDERLRHGGGHTGWSRAWMINFYARLKDAGQAHYHVQKLFEKSTHPNLFDNHPPFQIDGNFGGTAGIAEMLVQSHAGYVELLPALPEQWKTGKVSGLKARGGFQVDMDWEEGKLTAVRIESLLGNPLVLKHGVHEISYETSSGQVFELAPDLKLL
ncbi:MAG: glycoside hydrolase family 95 protein [Bacteroidota bacterium]